MDRGKINEAAWSIIDRANGKRQRVRKKRLSEHQRTADALTRRNEKERQNQLVGSRGAAGPCRRIDPVTGDIIGIVKKSRRGCAMEESR